jgi:hypothetical protein
MDARWGLAAALAATLTLGGASAQAEGLQRDSDDYNCSRGAVDDPRTIAACSRLRGEPVSADEIFADRRKGFQRANDDWRCHHGRPGAPRTLEACRRLAGD